MDAVLSEDVDTLMFGSGLTLRNYSAEGKGSPTHVNLYDAQATKESAGLDREGMILVALMSGGDYTPEGIPGVGPKTACQAARAGFGKELCAIGQTDHAALAAWKARLGHEIATNESKHFSRKYGALTIPDDFPRRDVLRYYTHPCLSSDERLGRLKRELKWDQDIDFNALRTFTGEAFEWICVSGAKKFIRNLAPALLVKQLRLRGEGDAATGAEGPEQILREEDRLVKSIDKVRNHVTTDGTPELKLGFIPHDLVPIDLAAEDPDPELPLDGLEDGDEEAAGDEDELGATQKKRGPYLFDPDKLEKVWVLETYVKVGVPLKIQDWEESFRNARKYEAMKAQKKQTEKRHGGAKRNARGDMPKGALDRFATMMKPGVSQERATSKEPQMPVVETLIPSQPAVSNRSIPDTNIEPTIPALPRFRVPPSSQPAPMSVCDTSNVPQLPPAAVNETRAKRPMRRSHSDTTKLGAPHVPTVVESPSIPAFSNSGLDPLPELPTSVTTRRHRSPLRRTHTLPGPGGEAASPRSKSPTHRKRPSTSLTQARDPSASRTPKRRQQKTKPSEVVSLLTSSPAREPATPSHRQRSIVDWLSPSARGKEKIAPGTQKASGMIDDDADSLFWPDERASNARLNVSTQSADPFLGQGRDEPASTIPRRSPRQQRKSKVREPLAHTTANTSKDPPARQFLDREEPQAPPEAAPAAKTFRSFRTSSHAVDHQSAQTASLAPAESTSTIPTTSKAAPTEPLAKAVTKLSKVIRLRDSVPGTYALEVLDLSGSSPQTAPSLPLAKPIIGTNAKKRVSPDALMSSKDPVANAAPMRRWRVSQVEVLDLTGA